MAVITIGTEWSDGDQLTPTALNAKWSAATFASGAVDDSTTALSGGSIIVKTGGVTASQLASDSVTTVKILDANVETAKIADANVTNAKLAPTSGTAAVAGSGTGATGTNVIEAGSIGHADLNDDIISGQTELAAAPDDADTLLIGDADASDEAKKITIANLLTHAAIPKAFGVIDDPGGTPALVTGSFLNCSVATSPADADYTRVTLDNAMSGVEYVVVATQGNQSGYTGISNNVVVRCIDASNFDVGINSENPESIHFAVFGTLA